MICKRRVSLHGLHFHMFGFSEMSHLILYPRDLPHLTLRLAFNMNTDLFYRTLKRLKSLQMIEITLEFAENVFKHRIKFFHPKSFGVSKREVCFWVTTRLLLSWESHSLPGSLLGTLPWRYLSVGMEVFELLSTGYQVPQSWCRTLHRVLRCVNSHNLHNSFGWCVLVRLHLPR